MDLGYLPRRASRGNALVGHAGVVSIPASARLVRLRAVVGLNADDQPLARLALAAATRMGRLPRLPASAFASHAAGAGVRACGPVLRAVDGAQLRRVPQVRTTALQFPAGAVDR